MYRNVTGGRIVFQPVQNGPAGHVGKTNVERDRARLEFSRQSEGDAAAKSNQRLQVMLVGEIKQDTREGEIILDDQQHLIIGGDHIAVIVDGKIFHDGGGRGQRRREDDVHFELGGSIQSVFRRRSYRGRTEGFVLNLRLH